MGSSELEQAVFGTRKHPQAVAEDNALSQSIQKIVELRLSDDEVEIATKESKQKLDLNALHDPKHHARVSLSPSTDRKRDDACSQARQGADRRTAGAALAGILNPRFREFQFLLDQSCVRAQKLAERGRRDSRRPALNKLDAKPALQPVHGFRECRLRDVQAPGGLLQAPLLDDSGEIEQLAGIHEWLHRGLPVIKSA